MFISIEVPVRGPEAIAFYSQGPQSHLRSLTIQAPAKGLFFNAEIVFDIVPVSGPLDRTTRKLKHLKSHKQAAVSMEARGRQNRKASGGEMTNRVPKKKRKNRSARLKK